MNRVRTNPAATRSAINKLMGHRGGGSRQDGINVPGIGLLGQSLQPVPDRIRGLPVAMNKNLAFAERGVEPGVAERDAALEAGERRVALDGGELERERCDRAAEAGKHLGFET